MRLKSLNECRLKIGEYPPFAYNAPRSGGKATLLPNKTNNLQNISFPSTTFFIPPLTSKTTKFFISSFSLPVL